MTTLISLHSVHKQYLLDRTVVHALRGVDYEFEEGAYYSLVGPSGSGKSTLLHIIGAMDSPTSGEVRLNGQALQTLGPRELTRVRASQVGFVFQAFHLNPILTARENVAIALRFLGTRKREAFREAEACLCRVGLSERLCHYPAELSGGERQRVAIARALVKRPALILADEPTGNLDTATGVKVIDLLREIIRQEDTTIIQVTHDPEVAARSDVLLRMRDGRICA